jgi:hypothetical protein
MVKTDGMVHRPKLKLYQGFCILLTKSASEIYKFIGTNLCSTHFILNKLQTLHLVLALISTLLQVETWLEIAKKLMPDGRIMVNCGGADTAVSLAADTGVSSWVQNPTIKALCSAFPGQVRQQLPAY